MERLAGRYDLESEVARGRGRTLWRGRDTVLDRPVGVLLLDPGHPHADAVRQAARRASAVEHPGLLRVIDTAEDAGRVFVVTRWLAGAPLSDQLASGPLAPDQARAVVAAVAEALAAAAAEDVHHLVLDPRDVLLTDHGVVVVGVGVRAALEELIVGSSSETTGPMVVFLQQPNHEDFPNEMQQYVWVLAKHSLTENRILYASHSEVPPDPWLGTLPSGHHSGHSPTDRE